MAVSNQRIISRLIVAVIMAFAIWQIYQRTGQSKADVSVLVRDEANKPLTAKLLVFGPSRGRELEPERVSTDGEGRWASSLPPGPWKLVAIAPGHAARAIAFTKERAQALERVIVLDRGTSIEGRVLDAKGEPVAGKKIIAAPVGPIEVDPALDSLLAGERKSSANGRFAIEGLEDGVWLLSLADGSSDRVEGRGGDRDIILTVRAEREVEGRVVFRGAPRPDRFTVFVQGGEPESFAGSTELFRVATNVENPLVRVEALAFAPATVEASGSIADVTLHAATKIRGRVVAGETRAPIPRATVALLGSREQAPRAWRTSPQAPTDEAGWFVLAGVPSGEVMLAVNAPGWAYTHDGPFFAAPASELLDVELALDRGVTVKGKVRFEGAPIERAMIALDDERVPFSFADAFWVHLGPRTDQNGTFSAFDVEPGHYRMRVNVTGWRGWTLKDTIELDVGPSGLDGVDVDFGDGPAKLEVEAPRAGWIALRCGARSYSREVTAGERVTFAHLRRGECTLAFEKVERTLAIDRDMKLAIE